MKKIISIIALALFITGVAQAATVVQTMTTATNYVALTGNYMISSITLAGPSTGTSIKLFDQSDGTTNLATGIYVTYATYTSNLVQNVVTTTGITNFMTNSYAYTLAVTNAAATNGLPILATLVAPTATAVTFVFEAPIAVVKGLTFACTSSNTTAVVNYNRAF